MPVVTATMTGTVAATASFAVRVTRGMAAAAIATSIATASSMRPVSMQSAVAGAAVASARAGVTRSFSAQAEGVSSASASATLVRTSLTICDAIRDILMSWGMEQPCAVPQMAKIAALNVLNQAMQVLWNQAKDRNYWTQSTLAVAITGGTSTSVLSNTVQNVVGPARLSTGEILVPLANISEIETFSNAFLEGESAASPACYYVERNNQTGADPAKCTLMVSPTPAGNITVNIDIVTEAPRYSLLDLDTCPLCPIPHKYVESLLMRVCRYLAMHSHLFIARERQEAIVNGYAQARTLLDVADPLPGQSGENLGYRKGERDKS